MSVYIYMTVNYCTCHTWYLCRFITKLVCSKGAVPANMAFATLYAVDIIE